MTNSALDRINVRRLIQKMEDSLSIYLNGYLSDENPALTWHLCYPRWQQRWRAWIARVIFRFPVQIDGNPSWFLRWVGYESLNDTIGQLGYKTVLEETKLRIKESSFLKIPGSVIDIFVTPSKPVEHIHLNTEIDKCAC